VVAGAGQVTPSGQATQSASEAAPVSFRTVPGGQALAKGEEVPRGHTYPRGQGAVQSGVPEPARPKTPALHAPPAVAFVDPAGHHEPAAHWAHARAPAVAEKEPAGHGLGAGLPWRQIVPAGQRAPGVVAPSAHERRSGHVRHAEEDEAAHAGLYEPPAQGCGAADAAGQYEPGGQRTAVAFRLPGGQNEPASHGPEPRGETAVAPAPHHLPPGHTTARPLPSQ
jgi:hypothetical protein